MVVSKATGRLAVLAVGLRRERGYQVTGRAVDRTRVALLAVSHAVDDIYQGAVPALLPFFIVDRHYSYAAATGLTFAATALSSVIQRPSVPSPTAVTGGGWCPRPHGRRGWLGLSGLTGSYLLTWLAIALSGIGVAAFHPEAARAARAPRGDSQQAMSVFSVGGNVGFAIGPLFVSAVLVVAGLRGTVFLAVPAVSPAYRLPRAGA